MSSGRMVKQLLLHRIPVEPGDGTQAAGHSGSGAAAGLQIAGEALDIAAPGTDVGDAADTSWRTGAGPARTPHASGHASCQEPSQGKPFRLSEYGSTAATAVDMVAMGHLPGRAEAQEAGPAMAPSDDASPHRQSSHMITQGDCGVSALDPDRRFRAGSQVADQRLPTPRCAGSGRRRKVRRRRVSDL